MPDTIEQIENKILTCEEVARFHRDGFLIRRGFFAQEEIAELRETFMAQNVDGPVPGMSEITTSEAWNEPPE